MANEKELLEEVILRGYRDEMYKVRKQLSDEVVLHSTGDIQLIYQLLSTRFPSEPEHIMEYRLCNISRVTKTYFNKVVATLAKIERADDFVVTFKDSGFQKFCEEKIAGYHDLVNWFFRIGLKTMLEEPNGFVLVFPDFEDDILKGIRLQVFKAKQVLYVSEASDFIITEVAKDTYMVFDNNDILSVKVQERGGKKPKYTIESVLQHDLGMIPIVTLGGLVYATGETITYESFVSGVVPFWNQAMIEFSDKQAGIKQHLFPERWRYQSGVCPDCNGSGKVFFDGVDGRKASQRCGTCDGTGDPPTGIFAEIIIKAGSALDKDVPKPPVGYVQKDFSAIEYLDKDFKQNIYAGLAALNMEFLMERPIDQSGVAKEMDRQELNSFIYQIASHVTQNILTPIYRIIAKWYYYSVPENPDNQIPAIKTPVHYDFLSTDNNEDRLAKAKQGNVAPYIVKALEKKYIEKQFENFIEDQNYLLLVNTLDPLPGYSPEQKQKLLNDNLITREDLICSVNIETLLAQITYDRIKFHNFEYNKQKEILREYTQKLIVKIDKDKEQDDEQQTKTNTLLQGAEPIEPVGDLSAGTDD